MKQLMMLSIFSLFGSLFVKAQSGNVNELPPINELGTGTFMGRQGGLYPNGSNEMPANFYADAMAMARSVQPLNASGTPDPNGKIGFVTIGASTVAMFSRGLEDHVPNYPGVNKELVFVNCGIGGQDLSDIMDPMANYWKTIDARVKAAGLTLDQVQVIWFQEDNLRNRDNDFEGRINALTKDFTYMVRMCKERYPNAKLFYISGRHTTDFMPADGKDKHREPKAYINGWVCKQLIENQINGDPQLNYKGADAVAPLILWGTYFWTQGEKPRADGYQLTRDMIVSDGVHPTDKGVEKVSTDLVQFWATDPVSQQWFLENPMDGQVVIDPVATESTMAVYINNALVQSIAYSGIDEQFKFMLLQDTVVVKNQQFKRDSVIRIDNIAGGEYKFLVADATHAYAAKISVDEAGKVTVVDEKSGDNPKNKPGKTIDPDAPAWVVNGANKLPKLRRVLDPNKDVDCVITDAKGAEVLRIDDVLNKHTDLNAALERGEYKVTFYDANGKEILLPAEFNAMVRIKF